jgi:hypothetical protein
VPERRDGQERDRLETRAGECPREAEPQESQIADPNGETRGPRSKRRREQAPEARSGRAEARHAGERRSPEQSGFADDAGIANRRRGSGAGMRRRPSPAEALKGEPRERARLKHTGEIGEGARRRSGQEPQGRNVTRELENPGVVALAGMMALWGVRPRESGAGDAVERRGRTPESPGQTLERS